MVTRGEVWLVPLDPTVGSEIRKTRPCVIVSPDELNKIMRTVTIAPMTSKSHPARFRTACNFRGEAGLILLDQLRTVDRVRLVKHLGRIDASTLGKALETLRTLFKD